MIVERVEVDVELVGLDFLISASQCRLDPLRLPVVHAGANIERVFSDEHPHLGSLSGGSALRRLGLSEITGGLGTGPGALIETAVYHDAALNACRPDLGRCGMAVPGGRVRWGGCLVLEAAEDDECERQWYYARHRAPESTS
jgi:hypothetical protein